MNSPRSIALLLVALLVLAFGIAAHLQPRFTAWPGSRADGDVFKILLGDSRKLFANEFYVRERMLIITADFIPPFLTTTRLSRPPTWPRTPVRSRSNNHGEEENFMGPRRNWSLTLLAGIFPRPPRISTRAAPTMI